MLPYPDSIANASAATSLGMNMLITHAGGSITATGTKPGAFDIVWYQINVTDAPATVTCCRGTTCQANIAAASCTGTIAGSASHRRRRRAPATPSRGAVSATSTTTTSRTSRTSSFLNAWFSASTYADITGNGTATPDITDIFTFLNAWFGTCV